MLPELRRDILDLFADHPAGLTLQRFQQLLDRRYGWRGTLADLHELGATGELFPTVEARGATCQTGEPGPKRR
jgi:hypothetical protein